MWDRLNPAARQVMHRALDAAESLGHGYIGDEHVLLGLLDEAAGPAQRFLSRQGLDLASARAELRRLTDAGQVPQSHGDPEENLHEVGVDVDQVRARLTAVFGPDAVAEAVWRVSRRPWWRGGGRRRTPMCGKPLFAKRALALAVEYGDSRGAAEIGPEHLLYGVLQDLGDPFGTGLGRRGRKHLAQLGWSIGTSNPGATLLATRGLDPGQLRAQLSAEAGSMH
jgi:hypothetical protein